MLSHLHASKRRRAFTLIELLVVVIIIGILLSIGVSAYLRYVGSSHDSAAQASLHVLAKDARSESLSNNDTYPAAAALAANLQASEPQLTVATGSCSSLTAGDPKYVVVDPSTTTTSLVACVKSKSGKIFKLTFASVGQESISTYSSVGTIYFMEHIGSYWQIMKVPDDGSAAPTQLTSAAVSEMDPNLSPDGQWISYTDSSGIWKMKTDGTGAVRLLTASGNQYASWSPDGTKIVSKGTAPGPAIAIGTIPSGGGSYTWLMTSTACSCNPALPQYSPDGTKIAFEDTTAGQLYIMNSDGTGLTHLTTTGFGQYPHFSPDGTKILYTSDTGTTGHYNIWTMNLDGSGQTHITHSTTSNYQAIGFSPDGTKIVFQSNKDYAQGDLYTMNADGTNIVRLTTNGYVSQEAGGWR